MPKVQNFFKPRKSASSSEAAPSTPSVSAEKQSTIELHLEKSNEAEIIWTLKSVVSGYSACSSEDMNKTLAAKFPKFESTKSFQMSRSKSICILIHGLAPSNQF